MSLSPQLEGIEQLEGTYLFDLERSAKGLRLNRFLHGLGNPEKRELYKKTPEERRMVRDLDWRALIRYGAIFFCMEKLGRVNGVSNPEMVAHMRGETLEEFLKTRRVPGAR